MAQIVSDAEVYALSRGILGREPDIGGSNNYLNLARNGYTKEQIEVAMAQELNQNGGRYANTGIFSANPALVTEANNLLVNQNVVKDIQATTGLIARSDPFAFDAQWYLDNNPDLKNAGYSLAQATDHYMNYGMKEGRFGSLAQKTAYEAAQAKWGPYYADQLKQYTDQYAINKARTEQDFKSMYGGFDEARYLAANPDVAAAVQNGSIISGYNHWLNWGRNEGRQPFFTGGEQGRLLQDKLNEYQTQLQRTQEDLTNNLNQMAVQRDQQLSQYGTQTTRTQEDLQQLLGTLAARQQDLLQQYGLQETRSQEDVARQTGMLGANREQYMTEWNLAQPKIQEQIGGQAADAGLYNSSGRIQNQQEQAAQAERDKAAYERNYQYQTGTLQTDLARKLQDLSIARNTATREYNTTTGQAQQTAQRAIEDINRQIAELQQQYQYQVGQQQLAAQRTTADVGTNQQNTQAAYDYAAQQAQEAYNRQLQDYEAQRKAYEAQLAKEKAASVESSVYNTWNTQQAGNY